MSLPPPPKSSNDHDKKLSDVELDNELLPGYTGKAGAKPEQELLNVAFRGGIRAPSPSPSVISIDDLNNVRVGRNPDYLPVPDSRRHVSRSPTARPRSLKGRLALFWVANKGLALVMIAQVFGTLMNVTTRLLEMEGNNGKSTVFENIKDEAYNSTGKGYHPFQVPHSYFKLSQELY